MTKNLEDTTHEGNEIVETAQFFVLITDPAPQQAVLAFTSAPVRVARKMAYYVTYG